MKIAYFAAAAIAALPFLSGPRAAVADERAAVERAVKDYVEALYQVKPELIERGVHPALEKIGFWRPPDSDEYRTPGKMTFEQLVKLAGDWNEEGRELSYEIELLDVLDQTAAAKLTADWGIDYMHLMKTKDGWKIIHVLWQSHPPKG